MVRLAAVVTAAAALLLATGSCRLSPLAPVGDPLLGAAIAPESAPPGTGVGPGACSRVPTITRLRGEVRQGTLYLSGQLLVNGIGSELPYSPYVPGGWCLQVFLNTDQLRTGYWRGYDYIVRGVEWTSASHAAVVRRITLEPGYPGGWGPASGAATLQAGPGNLTIAIPLGAIGDDEGNLDFALETYATVACAECASGVSHEYGADYFGRCSVSGPPALASAELATADTGEPWGPRPHTGSSAPGR